VSMHHKRQVGSWTRWMLKPFKQLWWQLDMKAAEEEWAFKLQEMDRDCAFKLQEQQLQLQTAMFWFFQTTQDANKENGMTGNGDGD
jgi:hypothetical protein